MLVRTSTSGQLPIDQAIYYMLNAVHWISEGVFAESRVANGERWLNLIRMAGMDSQFP